MLSFFPRGVLDEIWDLIDAVSEDFTTHSYSVCTFMHSDQNLRSNNSSMVPINFYIGNCTARQCSPMRRKSMECSLFNPVLRKHLVIGQRQKASNFSAFHWSTRRSLDSTGQHIVTTRVVHLPKRTKTSLITESDLITEADLITE